MLGTQKPTPTGFAHRLTGQPIGVAAYLLIHIVSHDVAAHTNHTPTLTEEIRRLTRAHREHIVIEIQKLLIEALNAMQAHLNGVAVERGEKFRRNDVAVQHHVNLVPIQPLGHLTLARHYKVDLTDKRHILRNATEKVLQCAPITEAFFQNGSIGIVFIVLLPHGVQTIDVCDYNIHLTTN
jgi:hypothetical protein